MKKMGEIKIDRSKLAKFIENFWYLYWIDDGCEFSSYKDEDPCDICILSNVPCRNGRDPEQCGKVLSIALTSTTPEKDLAAYFEKRIKYRRVINQWFAYTDAGAPSLIPKNISEISKLKEQVILFLNDKLIPFWNQNKDIINEECPKDAENIVSTINEYVSVLLYFNEDIKNNPNVSLIFAYYNKHSSELIKGKENYEKVLIEHHEDIKKEAERKKWLNYVTKSEDLK